MLEAIATPPPTLFAGLAVGLVRRGFLKGEWAPPRCTVRADAGRLGFRPDIYGWDRKLSAALARGD